MWGDPWKPACALALLLGPVSEVAEPGHCHAQASPRAAKGMLSKLVAGRHGQHFPLGQPQGGKGSLTK